MSRISRRQFLGDATLAAAAVSSIPVLGSELRRTLGPNSKLRVAVIGVKGRGSYHLASFLKRDDVEVAAICDIDSNHVGGVMARIEKQNGKKPVYYQDARKLFDDQSIDAVSIATCNHTHSLLGVWAMQAGKHAYVEKPLSHNVWEGRKLVEVQKKHGKVLAHGTQCRSMKGMCEAMAFLHSGKLGKVKIARGFCYKERKSIGKVADGAVPEGVDHNLWLGPAPERPFNPNKFHYNWHWNWDTGNGDLGNQGVHQMDIARWGVNKQGLPHTVQSVGGRLGYQDDGETPNTQIGLLDYGDCRIIFEVRGLSTDEYQPNGDKESLVKIGVVFECTEGVLVVPTYTSAIAYDLKGKLIQRFGGGDDVDHFLNFIDAVKANRPEGVNATALDGHLSSSLCHMVNISHRVGELQPLAKNDPFSSGEGNETFNRMRSHLQGNEIDLEKTQISVGRALTIDPKTESFVDNAEANKLLTREYRKPFVIPEQV